MSSQGVSIHSLCIFEGSYQYFWIEMIVIIINIILTQFTYQNKYHTCDSCMSMQERCRIRRCVCNLWATSCQTCHCYNLRSMRKQCSQVVFMKRSPGLQKRPLVPFLLDPHTLSESGIMQRTSSQRPHTTHIGVNVSSLVGATKTKPAVSSSITFTNSSSIQFMHKTLQLLSNTK